MQWSDLKKSIVWKKITLTFLPFFSNGDGRRKTQRKRNEFFECFYWQFLQWLSRSLTLSFSASFVATLAESAQASACLKQTHKNDMETMAKEQCNWQAAARQWQKQNIFLISLSVVARRYSFARDGDHPLSLSLSIMASAKGLFIIDFIIFASLVQTF